MTGVLVATGVPLKLSPKENVWPSVAKVVEPVFDDEVVAVTTVSAAADALWGILINEKTKTAARTVAKVKRFLLEVSCMFFDTNNK